MCRCNTAIMHTARMSNVARHMSVPCVLMVGCACYCNVPGGCEGLCDHLCCKVQASRACLADGKGVLAGAKLDLYLAQQGNAPLETFSRYVVMRRYHHNISMRQNLMYRWRLWKV